MNADDYYGAEAFRVMSEQLEKLHSAQDAAMVAYRLKKHRQPLRYRHARSLHGR